MFLDLLGVPDDGATDALECMCKAVAEGGDTSIWAPHHSPFLATLIESFTANGLQMSAAMAAEVMDWLTGKHYLAQYADAANPGPFPWPASDLPKVHAYLCGRRPAQMSFDDWLMLGDYIVCVHAPPGFVRSHADWMAARASAMGRLQAQRPDLPAAQADNALASLPSTVAQALAAYRFSSAQAQAMQYAAAHCAEAIVAATDDLRHGIKGAVLLEMMQPHVPGVPGRSLEGKLSDAFGKFNRDWRRIAVTEAGEAANQGFIASLPQDARVRRMEHYAGACDFCRRLHDKVFAVVPPDAPGKNGQTQVWPGKSNIGRSASPTRIVDGVAVKRTEDELWWPAAGTQHPHCRGLWVKEGPTGAGPGASADPNWDKWLSAVGAARS